MKQLENQGIRVLKINLYDLAIEILRSGAYGNASWRLKPQYPKVN
jgi:hypothetical protein